MAPTKCECGATDRFTLRSRPQEPALAHTNTEATQPSMTRCLSLSCALVSARADGTSVRVVCAVGRAEREKTEKRKKEKREKKSFFCFGFVLCRVDVSQLTVACGAVQLETEKHNGKRFWQAFRRLRQEGQ
jgi:hypothetical protein